MEIEKCRIVKGDHFDGSDIIEVKKEGVCEDCRYTGKVWFIEGDEAVGLCDKCLKMVYKQKIVYYGKEYPKCGMILKIVKRGNNFEVLSKPLEGRNSENVEWGSFDSGPGTYPALFRTLPIAKEFIKFLDDANPDFDAVQVWIEHSGPIWTIS